jgi:RNA polymerase sigma factor (sigma-70 family)
METATATIASQGGAPAVNAAGDDGDWTPPSWDEIVRDHSARVYRLAFRLTGNRHDAEDLTQEVFVRVFKALPTFRPGTLEGWMHRITTNLFLDQARRRRRIRFDALPIDFGDKVPGPTPSPDSALARDLFDPDIEAALAELPPEYRAAVVLCDIEELTYEEIAQALDVKIGTVRSRIHRGRSMLRKALTHRAPTRDRTRYGGPLESEPSDLGPTAPGSLG